jgi:protoporphyrinogen/coproporphyrinogen III oxidase
MRPRIVLLGAGISALAAAWFLKKNLGSKIDLLILEKEARAGGWIQTVRENGFLFEQGPRSCRSNGNGQESLALIEALGLESEILIPHPAARNRYLYGEGGLKRLPKHLYEVPFHSLTRSWPKALWNDWRSPKRADEDESIQQFFSRRLGESWAESLIDPFVSGIYAGDCSRLSLKSCFPLFDQWEQEKGSLLKGAWGYRTSPQFKSPFVQSVQRFPLFSFKEGMETLPRALADQLKVCLLLGHEASNLKFHSNRIEVKLKNGEQIEADHLISTLPAFSLGTLLEEYPSLSGKLKELKYGSILLVNIGFKGFVLPYKGFGYLVPSKMKLPLLGCVWDSSIFPQQNGGENQTRLTLMFGGSRHPEVMQLDEAEAGQWTRKFLHEHLGIDALPDTIQVKRACHAIPQFEVGFDRWKREVLQSFLHLSPSFHLSGSSFTGVSINDCISQGRQLAQQITNSMKN